MRCLGFDIQSNSTGSQTSHVLFSLKTVLTRNSGSLASAVPVVQLTNHGLPESTRAFLPTERSLLPFRLPYLSQAWPPSSEHRAASFAWSSTCPCPPHQTWFQYDCPA